MVLNTRIGVQDVKKLAGSTQHLEVQANVFMVGLTLGVIIIIRSSHCNYHNPIESLFQVRAVVFYLGRSLEFRIKGLRFPFPLVDLAGIMFTDTSERLLHCSPWATQSSPEASHPALNPRIPESCRKPQ